MEALYLLDFNQHYGLRRIFVITSNYSDLMYLRQIIRGTVVSAMMVV